MFSLALAVLVVVSQSAPPSLVAESAVVSVRNAFQARPVRNPDSTLVAPTPALLDAFRGGARRLRMTLPAHIGDGLELELERFEVTAPGVRFLVASGADEMETAAPSVALYRGRVAGDPHSSAFLAVSESRVVMGRVERHGSPSIAISAASQGAVAAGAADDWVLKRSDGPGATPDLVPPCGVTQAHRRTAAPADVTAGVTVAHGPQFSTLAIEGDQSFTQLFPDVPSAQAYVVALIGAVNEIYQRDLDMKLVVDRVRLWPAGGMPFGADNLSGFANYWVANEPTAGINQVHLLSGRRDLSYGGVAYVGGFCGGPTFGISGFLLGGFPSPVDGPDLGNWDVIVSAHEMGHNLGTFHTHDGYTPPIDQCGSANLWAQGEIMSYCHTLQGGALNIDMRFSTRIQDVIADEVAFEGCLPFDCNGNNVSDATDIALGAPDANFNGIPDVCEDCDGDSILDSVEISGGAPDVDGNSIPDSCEPDCNANNLPDEFDTAFGFSPDANANRVPDSCDPDCDGDSIPDFAEIAAIGSTADIDRDQIPDACIDCDNNGQPDWADLGRPGFIYVADQGSDTVRVYHARSGVLETTLGAGLLADPYDLTFGPDGMLYVTSFASSSVVRIDPQTSAASTLVASGAGGLAGASGIAFHESGRMFVGSKNTDQVLEFGRTDGSFVQVLIGPGVGGLVGPGHFHFYPDTTLLVGTSNDAVLQYAVASGVLTLTPAVLPGQGGLTGLRQFHVVSTSTDSWYYAASFLSDSMLEYKSFSGFQGVFNDEYPLTGPTGVAANLDGNLLVARTGVQPIRIIEYDIDTGRYVRSFIRGDFAMTAPSAILVKPATDAPDCNRNWRDDDCELAAGLATDVDQNGLLDECQQSFTLLVDDNVFGPRMLRVMYSAIGPGPRPESQAIRVSALDLDTPVPPPPPCCPEPNFSAFEAATCSAPGEGNACVRWLGPPRTILESQNNAALGAFRASRLQCTPYYQDWSGENWVAVTGAEIIPSSIYHFQAVNKSCAGLEETCVDVSPAVSARTRRAGDVAEPWGTPTTMGQPSPTDVVAMLDRFKNQPGAPSKAIAQVQPNVTDLNADVGALDIVAVIDYFKGYAYQFSGPCPCPSTAICGATACSTPAPCSGGTCVHACVGGSNNGLPCNNNSHCPGGGVCGPGFCRDRCGRCTP